MLILGTLRRAAILAACAALLACDGGPSTGTPAAPAPSAGARPAATVAEDSPERRIAAANAAFADGRFVAPAGDNALEWLAAAQALQPSHPGVVEGLVDLYPIALSAAERSLQAGDADEARRIADLLDRAQPGALGTRRLRERIDAAPLASAAPPPAAPIEARTLEPAAPTESRVAEPAAPVVAPLPRPPRATAPASTSAPNPPVGDARRAAEPTPTAAPRTPPAAPIAGTDRGADVQPPRVVLRVEPAYPQLARQRRIEGWVELDFLVTADGRPSDIRVVESSPNAIFDLAATRALQRWRFEPARRGDSAQAMRSRTRISFRLG